MCVSVSVCECECVCVCGAMVKWLSMRTHMLDEILYATQSELNVK